MKLVKGKNEKIYVHLKYVPQIRIKENIFGKHKLRRVTAGRLNLQKMLRKVVQQKKNDIQMKI